MLGLEPAQLIARIVVLLVAFTIHELAHAVTADYLGDDTPRLMGRISLNPLVHLDPLGSLLLLVAGFGWAKPVLVNPLRMYKVKNVRMAMALVAIAGPVSNIVMAIIAAIPIRLGVVGVAFAGSAGIFPSTSVLLTEFIWINLILAVFNMIPLAPLDGSKVLAGLLPSEMVHKLQPLEQYGPIILLILVFSGRFLPFDPLTEIIVPPTVTLFSLLLG